MVFPDRQIFKLVAEVIISNCTCHWLVSLVSSVGCAARALISCLSQLWSVGVYTTRTGTLDHQEEEVFRPSGGGDTVGSAGWKHSVFADTGLASNFPFKLIRLICSVWLCCCLI